MIKSNELRVGNLLQIAAVGETRPIQVTAETIARVERFKELSDIILEPIPLTEEWLLKFGFVKGETSDFGISLKRVPDYSINDFRIMLSDSVYHYIRKAWDGGSSQENESLAEIKYVHQLQNLYFALTGEELTIKP
jgi:hypothetical protein